MDGINPSAWKTLQGTYMSGDRMSKDQFERLLSDHGLSTVGSGMAAPWGGFSNPSSFFIDFPLTIRRTRTGRLNVEAWMTVEPRKPKNAKC